MGAVVGAKQVWRPQAELDQGDTVLWGTVLCLLRVGQLQGARGR